MRKINESLYMAMVERGLSATHPILAKVKGKKVIVCSVASTDGESNYDYSMVFLRKDVDLDGNDEDFLTSICNIPDCIEREKGHKLAIRRGMDPDKIQLVHRYIERS